MKILFISGGNMCQAIIGGLIAKGTPTSDLQRLNHWRKRAGACKGGCRVKWRTSRTRSFAVDVLVLAVKPR
ncbi:MAG: NAD(P)-binding domain-containing protein [Betaproteobacteria bacterium]|nr:NAD(P)-binding domain-containing protein [Betaproteobacteria bacterium]